MRIVKNSKNDKMRGYAFIEFDKERDMHGKLLFFSLQSRTTYIGKIYDVRQKYNSYFFPVSEK